MKILIIPLVLLLLVSGITANTWVNHTYDETDWTICQAMSYNGYNLCQASLTVTPPEDYIETASTDTFFPEWELTTVLNYGPTNSCNVTLEAFGTVVDLNLSINYTQQHDSGYFSGYSTIYGPFSSEYEEGEGWYTYDVRSSNHVDYTSVCGDTFSCVVDVINQTDDSIAYIQVISGYYDCSLVPPYSFTLLYDGVSMHNSNTSFIPLTPIPGPLPGTIIIQYQSNLTISNSNPCISGTVHSCYIEIYNDTDNSTLYVGNLSALDDNCLSINPGTTPGIQEPGFLGGAGSVFGVAIQSFILICCFLIILIVMCTVKPVYFGILVSVLAGDFLIHVMQLMTIPLSLYLLINALAFINFFRGVRG